ncbi:hypothetical protein [Streptomyces sp. NBC_00483]|uniref:hypothetical protein n=1 Tax=Streptomyces sp. NBC_00483 TaxID=2975756 RepID=UPI002E178611
MPSAASGYRPLLRIPGATAFFLSAALGRVGIAMTGIGLVWLLHARTGSYGKLGALSGARWAHLLRDGRDDELPTAFSLESLANASAFLLGPVLVTALGAAGAAPLASALATALVLGGGGALTLQTRTAPCPARRHAEGLRTEPTLLRPEFLLLAALNLAIGLYFGTMSLSVSAFATEHGTPGAAAPVVAAASLAGLLSGWLYGLRRPRSPAQRQRSPGSRGHRPPATRLSHRQATRLSHQHATRLSRQQECTYCGFA